MDHSSTYLSNIHFSTNKPLSSTIHISNFSGHWPNTEWWITTFFWTSLTNFICPSLAFLYLQCQEIVNPYPVSMTLCISTLFLLLYSQLWLFWLKVPPFLIGQEPFCISDILITLLWTFCSFTLLLEMKIKATLPIRYLSEGECCWKRGMLTASQKMSVL